MTKIRMTLLATLALSAALVSGCDYFQTDEAPMPPNQAKVSNAVSDNDANAAAGQTDADPAKGSNDANTDATVDNANKVQPAVEAPALATVGMPAPNFTLKDAMGNTHNLSDYAGKTVVLEWVNYDCPFVVRQYAKTGNFPAMQKKYRDAGVVWLSICSSSPGTQGYFEGAALTDRIAKENADANFYLIDADGEIGHKYRATNTPHMYVIDADGVLRFRGAIDNDRKGDMTEGKVNYVEQAISAISAGMEVETKENQAYGCGVKYAK